MCGKVLHCHSISVRLFWDLELWHWKIIKISLMKLINDLELIFIWISVFIKLAHFLEPFLIICLPPLFQLLILTILIIRYLRCWYIKRRLTYHTFLIHYIEYRLFRLDVLLIFHFRLSNAILHFKEHLIMVSLVEILIVVLATSGLCWFHIKTMQYI